MDHTTVHWNCFGEDAVEEVGMVGVAEGVYATLG